MASAIFQLFEVIADELGVEPSKVLNRANLELDDSHDDLFEDLRQETQTNSSEDAIVAAIKQLAGHFSSRGSALPFIYEESTGRFSAVDGEYLTFIRNMREIRSVGKRSADFEIGVLGRLSKRATGSLHRVGFPREHKKKAAEFNLHLKTLGFNGKVIFGKEKDGGFDILWALPLGDHPHRPLISVQCKNGLYDLGEAHKSIGTGSSSLAQHLGLQTTVHVPCVLFNDYLIKDQLGPKQLSFVPLGLSDLGALTKSITVEVI